MRNAHQGRRTFLKVGAAAGGGLIVGFHVPGASKLAAAAGPARLNAFVSVGTDGHVTVYSVDKHP